MKAYNFLTFICFLPTMLILSSCDQHLIEDPVSSAPTVIIMSPTSVNTPFQSGERVLIQVDFSDDVELHEMAVFIEPRGSNQPIYQRNLHKHGNAYRWIEDTAFVVNTRTEFIITAIATDHELQRSEEHQFFTIEPN